MITLAVHSQQVPDRSFELSELLDRRPETHKASSWTLDPAPYLFNEGQAVVEPSGGILQKELDQLRLGKHESCCCWV